MQYAYSLASLAVNPFRPDAKRLNRLVHIVFNAELQHVRRRRHTAGIADYGRARACRQNGQAPYGGKAWEPPEPGALPAETR